MTLHYDLLDQQSTISGTTFLHQCLFTNDVAYISVQLQRLGFINQTCKFIVFFSSQDRGSICSTSLTLSSWTSMPPNVLFFLPRTSKTALEMTQISWKIPVPKVVLMMGPTKRLSTFIMLFQLLFLISQGPLSKFAKLGRFFHGSHDTSCSKTAPRFHKIVKLLLPRP